MRVRAKEVRAAIDLTDRACNGNDIRKSVPLDIALQPFIRIRQRLKCEHAPVWISVPGNQSEEPDVCTNVESDSCAFRYSKKQGRRFRLIALPPAPVNLIRYPVIGARP
jgi:hypothetical protein